MRQPVRFWRLHDIWWRLRRFTPDERTNLKWGLERDFELPYPYPRNEYEEGMNWVAVNPVVSGRHNR